MNRSEIFPILSGLLLGALLGWITPQTRQRFGVPAAVALAFLATVISGEFRISWGFLLVDVPLVSLAAVAAFTLLQRFVVPGVKAVRAWLYGGHVKKARVACKD
jgi:hypothetical protein